MRKMLKAITCAILGHGISQSANAIVDTNTKNADEVVLSLLNSGIIHADYVGRIYSNRSLSGTPFQDSGNLL